MASVWRPDPEGGETESFVSFALQPRSMDVEFWTMDVNETSEALGGTVSTKLFTSPPVENLSKLSFTKQEKVYFTFVTVPVIGTVCGVVGQGDVLQTETDVGLLGSVLVFWMIVISLMGVPALPTFASAVRVSELDVLNGGSELIVHDGSEVSWVMTGDGFAASEFPTASVEK